MGVADDLMADVYASNAAKAKAKAAEADKYAGPIKAIEAFTSKGLDTFTGGGVSWLESVMRNAGQPADKQVTADQVRKEWADLHKARSGWAAGGELAGNIGQFTGVGKGINLAAKAAQAAPWLARGGKALQTAMNAPGTVGGAVSGGITGTTLGVGKEAGRVATEDEPFHLARSLGRVAQDAVPGVLGGAGGGFVSSILPKGQLASLAKTPIDEKVIGRVATAADDPIAQALGKTAAEGKLAGHEAIRLADEPTLATVASKLSGLNQYAGKGNTGTLLPEEAAAVIARQGKAANVGKLAGNAARAEKLAAGRVAGMGPDKMTPEAYWKVQDSPMLRGLRDRILSQERAAATTGHQAGGMTKTKAQAQAARDLPSDVVEAVTRLKPHANVDELAGIRGALDLQSPFFKALHAAEQSRTLGQRLGSGNVLGRGHAAPPAESAGLPNVGALFNPKFLIREAALLGRDMLQGAAKRGAAQRNLDMPVEELLRIIGKRHAAQRALEATLPGVGSFVGGNAF